MTGLTGAGGSESSAGGIDEVVDELIERGKVEDAAALLRDRGGNASSDTWLRVGVEFAELDREEDAIDAYERAVKLGNFEAALRLGLIRADQELWELAVPLLELSVERGYDSAWHPLGWAYRAVGQIDSAIRYLTMATDSGDSDAMISLAFLYKDLGHDIESQRLMARAAHEGNREAASVLAYWEWERTLDVTLEARLREGAEHYQPARGAYATLLKLTSRSEEAIAVLQQGVDRGEVHALIPLGNLYEEAGDPVRAAQYYQADIDTGGRNGYLNLGLLHEEAGDSALALELYRRGAAAGDEVAAAAVTRLEHN